MVLSLLDILYIVLILFTCIIGTLLTIVLVKVIRAMEVLDDVVHYYTKAKKLVGFYAQTPDMIKEKLKSFFK